MRESWSHEGEGIPEGLWRRTVQNAERGKKGQALLRELEAALLALPVHELGDGWEDRRFERPLTCALGAHFVAKRGVTVEEMHAELGEYTDDLSCSIDESTLFAHNELGWQWALAWTIGLENDEFSGTPAARHAHMLAWVRSRIKQEVSV